MVRYAIAWLVILKVPLAVFSATCPPVLLAPRMAGPETLRGERFTQAPLWRSVILPQGAPTDSREGDLRSPGHLLARYVPGRIGHEYRASHLLGHMGQPGVLAQSPGGKDPMPADDVGVSPGKGTSNRLVAWWRLDETDGNEVADSSGNGCSGKVVGKPRWRPAGGRVGGALEFDGTGTCVVIDRESPFDLTEVITVAAWVKVNRFDKRWQAIVCKGDTAWRIQRAAQEDTVAFHCTGITSVSGKWPLGIEGRRNIDDGQWHHIVGVYDGSVISLYVDGVLDNSSEASGRIGTNDAAVVIGGNSGAKESREWNGLLDEVCVFGCAIDAKEVSALYAGKSPLAIEGSITPVRSRPTVTKPGSEQSGVHNWDTEAVGAQSEVRENSGWFVVLGILAVVGLVAGVLIVRRRKAL
jgi:LPXTG-motif cell wall-anchored protein